MRIEALKKAGTRSGGDVDSVTSVLGAQIIGIKNVDIWSGCIPVLYENYMIGNAAPKSDFTHFQPGNVTVTAMLLIFFKIR
ncbi:MAG: hypothetical protein ABR887_03525 [Methanoregulaceae archaeon]